MIKKLLIFALLIVVIVAGIAGYLLMNLNKLVAGMKPKIEQAASEALGTKFTISELETGVFPKLKLSLRGISAEGKSKENLADEKLAIGEVNLFIDLKGLLSGSLVVEELSVVAPEITFIKEPTGVRVAGFVQNGLRPYDTYKPSDTYAKDIEPQAAEQLDTATSSSTSTLPLTLGLEGLRIDRALFRVIDRSQQAEKPKILEVRDFNLSSAASFKDGIFRLKGLDAGLDIFSGNKLGIGCPEIALDINSKRLQIPSPMFVEIAGERAEIAADLDLIASKGRASLASQGLRLESFSGLLSGVGEWLGRPIISSLGLKGQLKPRFDLLLSGMEKEPSLSGELGVTGVGLTLQGSNGVNTHSLEGLTGVLRIEGDPKIIKVTTSSLNLTASSGSFRTGLPIRIALVNLAANLQTNPVAAQIEMPELGVVADGQQIKLAANIAFKEQILKIAGLKFAGFSGGLNGDLELNLATSAFSNRAQAQNIKLAEAMRFALGNVTAVSGELRRLSSNVSGRLGADLVLTLQGGAEADLKNLSIQGFNLLREVLAEVKSLPFISGALVNKVPSELQSSINSDSTPLDEVRFVANFQSGSALIRSLEAKSALFNLSGQGDIKLGNNRLNLQTDFAIKPPMSIGLADKVRELRPLLNDQQLLVFPLRIEGVPPKLIVYPDPSKLLEKVGRKLLEQKGQKLLKGLLGF